MGCNTSAKVEGLGLNSIISTIIHDLKSGKEDPETEKNLISLSHDVFDIISEDKTISTPELNKNLVKCFGTALCEGHLNVVQLFLYQYMEQTSNYHITLERACQPS